MTFSEALEQLKQGKKLKRKNWNGKNQFVFLVKGETINQIIGINFCDDEIDKNLFKAIFEGSKLTDLLAIKTTSNQIQLGWLASQTDMLSDDWEVVNDG